MKGSPALRAVPADVSAALDELGIEHKIAGDEALGLCPSPDHNDSRPSWSCNLSSGLSHCFSCGWGGSFTRLVAAVRGVRADEADLWVRTHRITHWDDASVSDDEPAPPPAQVVSEADLWECGEPPADELAGRGVSAEAARKLEILWNPRQSCWVFPLRDPDTDRLIGWQEKKGKHVRNRPIGLDRHRSVFGLRHLKSTGRDGDAIIGEAPLNAARFLTAGCPRAVATCGIEFTDDQIAVIREWSTGIMFAQDNDDAGRRKIARWLSSHPEERPFTSVFDYGKSFEDTLLHCVVHPRGDGRDPGDLTDRELRRGVEWASRATDTYFEGINWWDS